MFCCFEPIVSNANSRKHKKGTLHQFQKYLNQIYSKQMDIQKVQTKKVNTKEQQIVFFLLQFCLNFLDRLCLQKRKFHSPTSTNFSHENNIWFCKGKVDYQKRYFPVIFNLLEMNLLNYLLSPENIYVFENPFSRSIPKLYNDDFLGSRG